MFEYLRKSEYIERVGKFECICYITSKDDIETKLQFLENEIVKLEKDWKEQKEKPKEKRKYISDKEHEKCKRVVKAYEKELDDLEVTVVDAGRFGFVKLIYYKFPYGFDDAIAYTDSLELLHHKCTCSS